MSETEQLEACDKWKVDPDDKPYQRMRDHAAEMEDQRNTARVVAADAIRNLERILDTGDTHACREIVANLKNFLRGDSSENR